MTNNRSTPKKPTMQTINHQTNICSCGADILGELPEWCDNGHWNSRTPQEQQ